MRIDLENVPNGAEFQSQICIVGAGVAGLLLAQQLTKEGVEVHLLEAGGEQLEQRSQDLYRTEMRGKHHAGTTEGRFRTFGGSSTRWAGQLLPYPNEVFQPRPVVGGLGWPVSPTDLEGYYPSILRVMGVNDLPFTDRFFDRFPSCRPQETEDITIRFSKWSPLSKRNLGLTLGKMCLAAGRTTVFFHANTTSINLHRDGSQVESLTVKNYQDGAFTFKAKTFILCCGTVETSRLLLNSTSVLPAGVGNATDQVGRYFHEHVSAWGAIITPEMRPLFTKYFAPYFVRNTLHTPRLEASPALQKSLNLLTVMAGFYIHEPEDSGFALLRRTVQNMQKGQLLSATKDDPRKLPSALWGALKTGYDLKIRGRRIPSSGALISMRIDTEQNPRPDSRIQLTDKLDAIGMPVAALDWKFSSEEADTLFRYGQVVHRYFHSLGMTSLQWNEGALERPEAWAQVSHDVYHPMGGTRMGDSPQTSVVDRDLRVHGVANLHISSCSVFPTGGSSNPTFTLMALSLRLADLLKRYR